MPEDRLLASFAFTETNTSPEPRVRPCHFSSIVNIFVAETLIRCRVHINEQMLSIAVNAAGDDKFERFHCLEFLTRFNKIVVQ